MSKRFTVTVDDDTASALVAFAKIEGKTINEIIRQSIGCYRFFSDHKLLMTRKDAQSKRRSRK